MLLQTLRNIPRALRKGGAGIAVAHFGIQRVQTIFQLDQRPGYRGDRLFDLWVFRRSVFHAVMDGTMCDGTQWRKRHGFLPAQRFHLFMKRFFEQIVELQQRQRKTLHIQSAYQRGRANKISNTLFQRRVRQLFGQ